MGNFRDFNSSAAVVRTIDKDQLDCFQDLIDAETEYRDDVGRSDPFFDMIEKTKDVDELIRFLELLAFGSNPGNIHVCQINKEDINPEHRKVCVDFLSLKRSAVISTLFELTSDTKKMKNFMRALEPEERIEIYQAPLSVSVLSAHGLFSLIQSDFYKASEEQQEKIWTVKEGFMTFFKDYPTDIFDKLKQRTTELQYKIIKSLSDLEIFEANKLLGKGNRFYDYYTEVNSSQTVSSIKSRPAPV